MSLHRRHIVLGGLSGAAALASFGMRPRRKSTLLGDRKLAQILPASFDDWSSREVSDLVAPASEGGLAARLYQQTVERIYQHPSGAEVMMLVAYGDTQSNALQLHRPEICYPAFGYRIVLERPIDLKVGGAVIPSRALLCEASSRQEAIIYWTRLGEFLPQSGDQQRIDRLRASLQGVVVDGLLARFSTLSEGGEAAFPVLEAFAEGLLRAATTAVRPALVGTQVAQLISGGSVTG